MAPEPSENGPEWLLEQAWTQVGRATTAEDRARALSTFRRAISTAHKHAAGEATPELLERVGQLTQQARHLYDEQADQHVRKAIRALGSLRMAVEARLAVNAGGRRGLFQFGDASWEVDLDAVGAFYGVPPEYRDGQIRVQMQFSGVPDVRVYRGRKLVWQRVSRPAKRHPPLALPHETPSGNGHP